MSYDIKYRQRAMGYLSEGNSYRKTAAVFKVSTSTLQTCKSQLKESGDLSPKKRRETWRKITPSKLKEYIEEHPDAYLTEMAEEFNCLVVAIFKALKHLKISRKKTTLYKEINENFRQEFVEKGTTIVLDNATFHRKSVLPDLAKQYVCEILFLPPYSPDLNPIEKKWAWLKRKLREILFLHSSFADALCACF